MMKMREIEELYSEELALLKRIQNYGKELRQGKSERVERVKFYFYIVSIQTCILLCY